MLKLLAAFLLAVVPVGGALASPSRGDAAAPAQAAQAQRQSPPPEAGQPPAQPPDSGTLPVSIERIKKALASESTLKLEPDIREDIPRFYLEVRGTPDIQTFLEGFDLVNGPVPGAAPTHADIMQLVTPKELYSQAGFSALEMLTANLSFAAIMYLAQKAFVAMAHAKSERELRQIREQIQRELAELEKAKATGKGGGAQPPG
jgi:hypothetical protein